jgi:DNA-binding transcriptional ArsR family regulator
LTRAVAIQYIDYHRNVEGRQRWIRNGRSRRRARLPRKSGSSWLLVTGGPEGLPAGGIAERLGVLPSSLSFHLQQLAHAGLITQRRLSRLLIYSAEYGPMNELMAYLTESAIRLTPLLKERAMKRLHVHVSVEDLAKSIRFYSTLFAAEPAVVEDDYAKWMLDDPRANFAISTRAGNRPGGLAGVSHLGIQVEDDSELTEVYDRLSRADRPVVEAKGTTCCYSRSDKQWIADPQGVPWETFLTYGKATVYGEGSLAKLTEANESAACGCEPPFAELASPAPAACCAPSCCAT